MDFAPSRSLGRPLGQAEFRDLWRGTVHDSARRAAEGSVMTAFSIMRERCGLSWAETAQFLNVPMQTVEEWASGRKATPKSVVIQLRALYRHVVHSGRELGERFRIELEQQAKRHVVIGIVGDDIAAQEHGFPCAGPHAAAVGIAIMLLPDDVTFELVPWRAGVHTAM